MRYFTLISTIVTMALAVNCYKVGYYRYLVKNIDDWTVYGGNIEHTNVSKSIVRPPFRLIWEYNTSAGFGNVAGAIVDSILFVSNLRGEVHAVSIGTGKGTKIRDFGTAIAGMPIIENGKMYVALTQTEESLIAYNLVSHKVEWGLKLGDIETTPLLIDNKLYVTTLEGKLICVNVRKGTVLWTFLVPRESMIPVIHSSPSSNGEIIFFGCDNGFLYAVNMSDGKLIWSAKTGGSIYATPTISNGKVFVGSLDSNYYAFIVETGKEVWKKSLGAKIISSQAISDGRIFIGTVGRTIYCLDSENGAIVWMAKTGGPINIPPIVSGSVVYFGCLDKMLYAFSTNNGNLLNVYKAEGRIKTQPLVSKNCVFLLIENRSVIALKQAEDT